AAGPQDPRPAGDGPRAGRGTRHGHERVPGGIRGVSRHLEDRGGAWRRHVPFWSRRSSSGHDLSRRDRPSRRGARPGRGARRRAACDRAVRRGARGVACRRRRPGQRGAAAGASRAEGEPVTGAKILAFGGYQPDKVVTNDDLAKIVDTNDEWIRSRVGIQSRRVARDDETVADMAEAAGAKALAASGLEPSEVDLVIVATCSPESPLPNVAASVAYRLGIPAPGAYDLNAACAGFCYAVGAASDS